MCWFRMSFNSFIFLDYGDQSCWNTKPKTKDICKTMLVEVDATKWNPWQQSRQKQTRKNTTGDFQCIPIVFFFGEWLTFRVANSHIHMHRKLACALPWMRHSIFNLDRNMMWLHICIALYTMRFKGISITHTKSEFVSHLEWTMKKQSIATVNKEENLNETWNIVPCAWAYQIKTAKQTHTHSQSTNLPSASYIYTHTHRERVAVQPQCLDYQEKDKPSAAFGLHVNRLYSDRFRRS